MHDDRALARGDKAKGGRARAGRGQCVGDGGEEEEK